MDDEMAHFVDLSKPSWGRSRNQETIVPIMIWVNDAATGQRFLFKLKDTTKLSTVAKVYADNKGVTDMTLMRFHFNGTPIIIDQTPGELGLQNNDVLHYSSVTNARHEIEKLLATESSRGKYCTGSEISGVPIPSVEVVLRDIDGNEAGSKKLSFPLDDVDIKAIKDNAERAGVGVGEKTVVNLDVRKTWQIKPHGLRVSNVEQALETALQVVARDFGTEADYDIEASLYKLLLYEEGCFFARHRDNERLDGMFGTLVLELPSEYSGAVLSVSSPLTPNEETTYTFNGSSTKPKRRTRSNGPGLHFAAFYADCYHQVSTLTSGHRAALVYHLTATPKQGQNQSIFCHFTGQWKGGDAGRHLPRVSPSPPQPADESVAVRVSHLMEKFASECDEDYQYTEGDKFHKSLGKPKKLAIVLSHHYTPASFASAGFDALKGSDRSIAEMIRAAAFCSPGDVPSLARMAAKKVVQVGGEEYAVDSDVAQVHDLVSEEFKQEEAADGPFFDAAIALATVWDSGEFSSMQIYRSEREESPTSTFHTRGTLIPLTGDALSLDLGPKLPADEAPAWHQSWFGPPVGSTEYPNSEEESYYRNPALGNHSLPIYVHELLFASEEARAANRKDFRVDGKHVAVEQSPKEVEFLGNGGGIYPGRIYSRAVIVVWPKAHRKDVQMQCKGGQAVLREESNGKKSE